MGPAQSVSPGRYVRASRGFGFDSRTQLALVYVVGDIMPGESRQLPGTGDVAGSDTVIRGLRQAAETSEVRGVILRVDSPGGSGTASDAIWREVALVRRQKPVIVSMGDYAASGGYYVSMGADTIVAERSTITGSIGVFSGKFSLRGLYAKLGLSEGIVQRGRNARLFSMSEPWDDEERATVREVNRAFYSTFVSKAAEGRHKTPDEIEAVAQGRVWSGEAAMRVGLVDRLGGMEVAVSLAREKARIGAGQAVRLVVMPGQKGVFDMLLERQEEDIVARALRAPASALLRSLDALAAHGPIARLPFEVAVR